MLRILFVSGAVLGIILIAVMAFVLYLVYLVAPPSWYRVWR